MNTIDARSAAALVYADKIIEAIGPQNEVGYRNWSAMPITALIRLLKLYKAAKKDRVSRVALNAASVGYRTMWMLLHGCLPNRMTMVVWPALREAMWTAGLEPRPLPSGSVCEARGDDIVETVTSVCVETITHKPGSEGFAEIVALEAPAVEIVKIGKVVTMKAGKAKPVSPGTPEFSKLVRRILAGKLSA